MAYIPEQNLKLTALAGVLAIGSAYCALTLAESEMAPELPNRRTWPVGAALSLGLGLWAASSLGMISLAPGLAMAMSLESLTIAAFIALVGCCGTFYAARQMQRDSVWGLIGTCVLLSSTVIAGSLVPALSASVATVSELDTGFVGISGILALGGAALVVWLLTHRPSEGLPFKSSVELVSLGFGVAVTGSFWCIASGGTVSAAAAGSISADTGLAASSVVAVSVATGLLSILAAATITSVNDRRIRAAFINPATVEGKHELLPKTIQVSAAETASGPVEAAPNILSLGAAVALSAKRVLVADAQQRSLDLLLPLLDSWRTVPLLAASAKQAIERVQLAYSEGERVDVILLDSRLDGGAFTFLEQLRQQIQQVPPIVLMLDGAERAPKPETLQSFGIATHIVKPIWRADLEHAMLGALLMTSPIGQDATPLATSKVGDDSKRS